jgi:hypothetical protein
MFYEVQKCSRCGKVAKVIRSNNPLVPGLCLSCLQEEIDYNNLKQAQFFCQTYNFPFLPDRWLEIADEVQEDVFLCYTEAIAEEYRPNLYYDGNTGNLWHQMNEEWKKVTDHRALLAQIKPIKQGFLEQMQIKWGMQYTFEEYIRLEDIYTNTVRRAGITNPLTMDIVKKIAVVSVGMDKALTEGEIKTAAEYSKMHKQLTDSAGLDKLIEVGSTDTINNVSDLCDYLEREGFQFNWEIDVPRDIVDQTIADQQEWIATFVRNETGINQTYELVEKSYRQAMEQNATDKAQADFDLEDILEATKAGVNADIDAELENDTFELGEVDDFDQG